MVSPGVDESFVSTVSISASLVAEIVAHCLSAVPEEGCGLLAGPFDEALITAWFPTRNAARSASRYVVDPADQLRADLAAERSGNAIVGVVHSHTHTDAYPSPTDVADAPDPTWHYMLVSLRGEVPSVRSFQIVDGVIREEELLVKS